MEAPQVARSYAHRLAIEKRAALGSVGSSWARMSQSFDASWPLVRPLVVAAIVAAQREVAELADGYVANVTSVTAPAAVEPQYVAALAAWPGLTGDGRPVGTLADGAVIRAKQGIKKGLTPPQALSLAGQWLTKSMGTVLADTHRGVEQMAAHSRRVGRYVRMVTGRSTCGRCIILAGRIYRMAEAFERHPECDCAHIPVAENVAGDYRTNPHDYLDQLDDDALAKALGSRANAEAWRDGADPGQLINAYRKRGDVRKAQLYGSRTLSYTVEGVTRRGRGYQAMAERHRAFQRQLDQRDGGRYHRTQIARLMPSSIYELAKDREDAIRLLRTYGWIL